MSEFGEKSIQAEEIANYLNQNREFFHIFPSLLDELSIPHPKSGQAISLLERQIFQLREKKDSLQIEVDALKDVAGENGELLNKVYEFAFALMATETDQEAVDVIYQMMRDVFKVDYVSFMSWDIPKVAIKGVNQLGISQSWSKSLKEKIIPEKPMCGLLENEWQKGLFTTEELMQSACIISLGKSKVWGVLALGSTTDRFTSNLGTYFLQVMGGLITARLQRIFTT